MNRYESNKITHQEYRIVVLLAEIPAPRLCPVKTMSNPWQGLLLPVVSHSLDNTFLLRYSSCA